MENIQLLSLIINHVVIKNFSIWLLTIFQEWTRSHVGNQSLPRKKRLIWSGMWTYKFWKIWFYPLFSIPTHRCKTDASLKCTCLTYLGIIVNQNHVTQMFENNMTMILFKWLSRYNNPLIWLNLMHGQLPHSFAVQCTMSGHKITKSMIAFKHIAQSILILTMQCKNISEK